MIVGAIHFSILGIDLRLASPEYGTVLLGVLLALLFVGWGAVARRNAMKRLSASPALLEQIAPRASGARWLLGHGLSVMGLLLLCLALLRPQLGEREVMVKQRGIDLVVAVDASRSMLARDVLPSRLERAKLELSSLIDRLGGDRIGLVSFAGDAFIQSPLTYDHSATKLFLRAIDPDAMPSQGTAIASALEMSARMLEAAEDGAKTRAILLLSDGEDHSGRLQTVSRELAEKGIRVFALGIGSEAGSPIPILDKEGRVQAYQKDRAGKTVLSRLNDTQLRSIAEQTSGIYVAARGGDLGMGDILAELARLEKTEREGRLAMEWEEAYHLVAFPGLILLLLGVSIPGGRRE